MTTPVRCPHCSRAFQAQAEHHGRRARCRGCGGSFVVDCRPGETAATVAPSTLVAPPAAAPTPVSFADAARQRELEAQLRETEALLERRRQELAQAEQALRDAHVATDAAQADAVAARASAATARAAAKAATSQAEASRTETEICRAEAETARLQVESAREQADASRAQAEAARAQADSARAESEAARAQADSARAEAEAARSEAEGARAEAHAARAQAESARAEAQAAGIQAESARAEAQAAGVQAEQSARRTSESVERLRDQIAPLEAARQKLALLEEQVRLEELAIADMDSRTAAARRALTEAERSLSRERESLAAAQREREEATGLRASLAAQCDQLRAEEAALRQSLVDLETHAGRLSGALVAAEPRAAAPVGELPMIGEDPAGMRVVDWLTGLRGLDLESERGREFIERLAPFLDRHPERRQLDEWARQGRTIFMLCNTPHESGRLKALIDVWGEVDPDGVAAIAPAFQSTTTLIAAPSRVIRARPAAAGKPRRGRRASTRRGR